MMKLLTDSSIAPILIGCTIYMSGMMPTAAQPLTDSALPTLCERPSSQSCSPDLSLPPAAVTDRLEATPTVSNIAPEHGTNVNVNTVTLADPLFGTFSVTTTLSSEVIVTPSDVGGSITTIEPSGFSSNNIRDRVRLNFNTSFTGKDTLKTRLQSRKIADYDSNATGTEMLRLGSEGDSISATGVSLLKYNFSIGERTKVVTQAIGAEFTDEFYSFNPVLTTASVGAVSRFGRFNPIYRLGNDGAAIGIDHNFSPELGISLAYGAPNNSAQDPNSFNGANVYFGQLRFTPRTDLNFGIAYARSYHPSGTNVAGGTGSTQANNPFSGAPAAANNYSFLASYQISPSFIVSGWAGFGNVSRETTAGGTASTSNYALTLAFPDMGAKGNVLGFVLGIPPKLTARNANGLDSATTVNPDTSYHLEALYKIKFGDDLAITPGLILVTSPNHDRRNPTQYVGTIRTTFKF